MFSKEVNTPYKQDDLNEKYMYIYITQDALMQRNNVYK